MFGNMGYSEILIICFLALLLFGAKRLPEIGSSLGKSIRAFKHSLKDLQNELPSQDELYREEPKSKPANSTSSASGTGNSGSSGSGTGNSGTGSGTGSGAYSQGSPTNRTQD